MNHESSTTIALDEIDRLFVVCDKAKEYLKRITTGIDQQVGIWQQRREVVFNSRGSSSSVDFLIPKTQRINELTIEAVQALCKVDVIVEQILRIDLQSVASTRSTAPVSSFSSRSIETKVSPSTASTSLARAPFVAPSPAPTPVKQQPNVERTLNAKSTSQSPFPIPVLRTLQQTGAGQGSPASTQEKAGFKPIEQQQQKSSIITDTNTTRPTPIHPQDNHYTATESAGFPRALDSRPSSSVRMSFLPTAASNSQVPPNYQRATQEKVKVKLQRIPPGTKWKRARIETIDSLSAFYVENHDERVHARFCEMLNELHEHYDNLEKTNRLAPLQNVEIGDFGVAKFEGDHRWYRARLLASEVDNQLRIVYIDFGNIEIKSMNNFFPLEQAFAHLPAQAIACSLSDAFPRSENENDPLWPMETIQIFQEEVKEKDVEVTFVAPDEDTVQWPLHFVKINVGNQSVNSSMNLKQCIEPRPNRFIAEKLMPSLTHQEYILFNVPIDDDEAE